MKRFIVAFFIVIGIVALVGSNISYAAGLKLLWTEDFEGYSSSDDMAKNWFPWTATAFEEPGLLDLVDEMNHTKDGSKSVKMVANKAMIRFVDEGRSINGKVTAYMNVKYKVVQRSAVYVWDENGDYIQVGVMEVISPSTFIVRQLVAKQDSGFLPVWIKATEGWHKIVIDVTEKGTDIYIDDTKVNTFKEFKSFNRVVIGAPWVGQSPVYFDDITVEEYVK